MIKLILKTSLVFCLASISTPPPSAFSLFRQYSTSQSTQKILNSLKPLKIYSSLHWPSKQKQMLSDLTGQGGILLFYSKPASLYAIEGSDNLVGYLQDLFNKEMLTLLADIKVPKAIQKKTKIQLKNHYQELLHQGWKDYELYLLETWKASEEVDAKHRLAYYHTKYQPKLNLFRYVYSANGKIETVYQWNRFKTEEQLLTASQKKDILKPLLTYRIDSKSPLDKLKAKIWYENKNKVGVYRWVNRVTKQSYIGSTLNLGQILYVLDFNSIADNQQALYSAMRKHGLTNFILQILAHCSKEELVEKEQYYLQLYQPEYNMLEDKKEDKPIIDISITKSPASLSAINTLDKQLVIFQPTNQQITSINAPPPLTVSLTSLEVKLSSSLIIQEPIKKPFRKTKKIWTLSDATRQKQSLARQKREKESGLCFKVQVQDLVTKETTIYDNLSKTALALNINKGTLSRRLQQKITKAYKKRYLITKV